LGHPTLAVTTVLAGLLIGGGLGSGWLAGQSPQLGDRSPSVVLSRGWPLPATIVGLVLLWLLGWPWLSDIFRAAPLPLRLLVVIGSLLPLALLMGVPFPLGLRRLTAYPATERHLALAWTVNGIMTVVGSVLAIAGAMLIGFSGVLLVGAGAYAVAAGLAYLARR
jgi:hypothetical protein